MVNVERRRRNIQIYNNRLLQCTIALHGLPVLDYLQNKIKKIIRRPISNANNFVGELFVYYYIPITTLFKVENEV